MRTATQIGLAALALAAGLFAWMAPDGREMAFFSCLAAAAAVLLVVAGKAFARGDSETGRLGRATERLQHRLEMSGEIATIFDGMNQLIETFAETRDLDSVLNQAAGILYKVLSVDVLMLELYSTEESRMIGHIVMPPGLEVEFDQELHQDVVDKGMSKLINDLSVFQSYSSLEKQGFRSILAAPMTNLLPGGKRESIGYVCGLCRERKDFGDRDLSLLSAFARQAALIIEDAQLFEKTRHLARTDGLTNLVNHRRFKELLDAEMRRSRESEAPLTLIMGDIDDFKHYNDTNGHLHGDMALRALADIMRRSIRGDDTAGRYGGEEFVMILPNTDAEGGKRVAENVRRRVEEFPFPEEASQPGGKFTITFGLATMPTHARDSTALIEAADRALYRGKGGGKNTVVVAELETPPSSGPQEEA